MRVVDLHIHTIFSDGTLLPREVVRLAALRGLSAIAITDHDEVGGLKEGVEFGERFGINVVQGIELSAKKEDKSIHLLGYFIDPNNRELLDFVHFMRESRLKRAEKIIDKLGEHGISIKMDDVQKHTGLGSIGRPHIAEALVAERAVRDLQEAFSKYLGDGKPCYVSKANVTPKSAIELILSAGGIPILAHPAFLEPKDWIPEFVDEGLMGIEVWYPSHSETQINKYLEIANKYKLVPTGGSDSHGTRHGYPEIGEFTVPYQVLERLEASRG